MRIFIVDLLGVAVFWLEFLWCRSMGACDAKIQLLEVFFTLREGISTVRRARLRLKNSRGHLTDLVRDA
jgi:hypothetical protein